MSESPQNLIEKIFGIGGHKDTTQPPAQAQPAPPPTPSQPHGQPAPGSAIEPTQPTQPKKKNFFQKIFGGGGQKKDTQQQPQQETSPQ